MRKTAIFLFAFLLLLPFAAGAWDTRILSLDSPSLSESFGVPTTYGNVLFPTDEFGIGLSAVADPLDIWKLPEQLANTALFPSSSVILDLTGSGTALGGNAGLVIPFKQLPLVLGVFAMRPSMNGWVVGTAPVELPRTRNRLRD